MGIGDIEKIRIQQEFNELAEKWKKETSIFSSINKIVEHSEYKKIIEMGADVLPLIFKDLEKAPNHWFYALKAITGIDPVPKDQRGNIKKMAEYWLNWARQNGYEW